MKVVVAKNGRDAEVVLSRNEWLEIGRKNGFITQAGDKCRTRPEPVLQSTHDKVTDNQDHFPIDSVSRARNALARVAQFSAAPKWWSGTLEELKNAVRMAVHSKYPSIDISK
jgi:hypothetical protein